MIFITAIIVWLTRTPIRDPPRRAINPFPIAFTFRIGRAQPDIGGSNDALRGIPFCPRAKGCQMAASRFRIRLGLRPGVGTTDNAEQVCMVGRVPLRHFRAVGQEGDGFHQAVPFEIARCHERRGSIARCGIRAGQRRNRILEQKLVRGSA